MTDQLQLIRDNLKLVEREIVWTGKKRGITKRGGQPVGYDYRGDRVVNIEGKRFRLLDVRWALAYGELPDYKLKATGDHMADIRIDFAHPELIVPSNNRYRLYLPADDGFVSVGDFASQGKAAAEYDALTTGIQYDKANERYRVMEGSQYRCIAYTLTDALKASIPYRDTVTANFIKSALHKAKSAKVAELPKIDTIEPGSLLNKLAHAIRVTNAGTTVPMAAAELDICPVYLGAFLDQKIDAPRYASLTQTKVPFKLYPKGTTIVSIPQEGKPLPKSFIGKATRSIQQQQHELSFYTIMAIHQAWHHKASRDKILKEYDISPDKYPEVSKHLEPFEGENYRMTMDQLAKYLAVDKDSLTKFLVENDVLDEDTLEPGMFSIEQVFYIRKTDGRAKPSYALLDLIKLMIAIEFIKLS